MKDLAGNAMACTVVGSCIAHSLVLAMKHNVFELPEKKEGKGEETEKKPNASPATQGDVQASVFLPAALAAAGLHLAFKVSDLL